MSLPITALGTATGPNWQHRIERSGLFSPWVNWSDTASFTTDPDGGVWRYNTPYWLYARNPTLPPFSQGSLENEIASTFYITTDGEVRYEPIQTADPAVTGGDYSFKPGNGEDATGWQYRLERADTSTAWQNWTSNFAFSQDPLGGNLIVDTQYWVYGRKASLPSDTPGAIGSELAASVRIRPDGSIESIDPSAAPGTSSPGVPAKTLLQLARQSSVTQEMPAVRAELAMSLEDLIALSTLRNIEIGFGAGNYLLRAEANTSVPRGFYILNALNQVLFQLGIQPDGFVGMNDNAGRRVGFLGGNLILQGETILAKDAPAQFRNLSVKEPGTAIAPASPVVASQNLQTGLWEYKSRSLENFASDIRGLIRLALDDLINLYTVRNIEIGNANANFIASIGGGLPATPRGLAVLSPEGQKFFAGYTPDGFAGINDDAGRRMGYLGGNLLLESDAILAKSGNAQFRTLSVAVQRPAPQAAPVVVSARNPTTGQFDYKERSLSDLMADLAPYLDLYGLAEKLRPLMSGTTQPEDARIVQGIFCYDTPVPPKSIQDFVFTPSMLGIPQAHALGVDGDYIWPTLLGSDNRDALGYMNLSFPDANHYLITGQSEETTDFTGKLNLRKILTN